EVAAGTVTVRDTANQQQDVAGLSRDTAQANDSISPIFDKEKEQKRLQEVSLIGEMGSQAADIARTQGELNALEEARKVYPDKTAEELKETQTWRDAQAEYGTGSDFQRGIQAATAALQGLAGGDAGAALAGASAPYLANIIGHDSGLSDDAALIAHAILGGAAAAMQGNSAAAGAAGAVTGELAAKAIMEAMYPDKQVSELSEAEKQTISMLASLSAGMAGALAGDSTSSAAAGAQSGKNAAENNSLSKDDEKRLGLRPANIIDINPLFNNTAKVLDENGEPLKGGGGAKFSINKGQQNKHIEGTNEYKTAAASSGSQRSVLTVDPQSLLPKLGTGQQVGKVDVGLAGSKERIDFGKPIGNFVDKDTGLTVPTTKGIVHYGKDGAHIVPARP
ncbi:polymorphic toxin type 50 domain-containing protein, partial [Citrobacter gillenii]|uniref:polymorphic toxin type 50 domain-containing protein n=1 Tax=Citrobacter gillenii TaxID=67828 RepID=UPI001ABF4B70